MLRSIIKKFMPTPKPQTAWELFGTHAGALSQQEQLLVHHVKNCIARTEDGYQVPEGLLKIAGGSSAKSRSLLNLLCTKEKTSYLEIGLWQGSTFISALHNNNKTIVQAIGLDDWSQYMGETALTAGPKESFFHHCTSFIPSYHLSEASGPYRVLSQDCFTVDKKIFTLPVNIYFYDGGHTQAEQEKAFTYFDSVLDNCFVAIVDDFSRREVQKGTYKAFDKLGYTVLFEQALPVNYPLKTPCDWWGGLYVAVIRKNVLNRP